MDMQNKTHFKMYKSGKLWLFAGVTAASVVGGTVLTGTHASADTTDSATTQAGESATTTGNAVVLANTTATSTDTTDKAQATTDTTTATVANDTTVTPVATSTTLPVSSAANISEIKDLDNSASGYLEEDSAAHRASFSDASAAASYFAATGTASAASDGTVTLTSSAENTGAYTFTNQVNMANDWTLSVDFNVADVPHDRDHEVGDFMGLVMTPVAPNSVATAAESGATAAGKTIGGGDLGINYTSNAYVWGFDYYENADKGDNAMTWTAGTSQRGIQVGLRHTDASGKLVAAGSDTKLYATTNNNYVKGNVGLMTDLGTETVMQDSEWFKAGDAYTGTKDSNGDEIISFAGTFKFSWDAENGILTVTSATGKTVGTYTLTALKDQNLSVGFLAATGGSFTGNSVKITAMDAALTQLSTNVVTYVDADGNEIADSSAFVANLGDTLAIDVTATGTTANGSKIVTAPLAIPGYEFVGYHVQGQDNVTTADGVLLNADSTIVLQYKKLQEATVNFVTETGIDLADTVALTGAAKSLISSAIANANLVPEKSITVDGETFDLAVGPIGETNFDDDADTNQAIYYYYKLQAGTVTNEPSVKTANAALNAVLTDENATPEAVQAALKDYNDAVRAAQADRDDAVSQGQAVSAPDENASDASKAAWDNLQKAITAGTPKSGAGTATTQDILDAIKAYQDATALDAARTAAAAVETAPVSLEDKVVAAKGALAKALANADATVADINDAVAAVNTAVADVTPARDAANTAAANLLANVPAKVADDADVAQKLADLKQAVANGTADQGTTAEIQAAIDALNKAITAASEKVDTEKTNADTTVPAHLADVKAVTDAQANLEAVIADPDATYTQVKDAEDAFAKALTDAEARYEKVVVVADKAVDLAKDVKDETVQKAVKAVQVAVETKQPASVILKAVGDLQKALQAVKPVVAEEIHQLVKEIDQPVVTAATAPVVKPAELPHTDVAAQDWLTIAGVLMLAVTAGLVTRRKREEEK
jgi:LPXTG-motif cell wall-anchored protein